MNPGTMPTMVLRAPLGRISATMTWAICDTISNAVSDGEVADVSLATAPALAASRQPTIERWIVDSGCGHDLISQDLARGFNNLVLDIDKSITFKIANGQAPAVKRKARLDVDELGDVAQAWVMNRSLAVLSLRGALHGGRVQICLAKG